jgi:hypothetical protein
LSLACRKEKAGGRVPDGHLSITEGRAVTERRASGTHSVRSLQQQAGTNSLGTDAVLAKPRIEAAPR